MSQNRPVNPKSVFVGNIPYDATEKELIDIFSEVGRVISFRLVEDRDLKKPKGYGFCEYADTDTALSAIRNLNNRELNKRTLRVSYADNDKALMNELMMQQGGGGGGPQPGNQGPQPGNQGPQPNIGVNANVGGLAGGPQPAIQGGGPVGNMMGGGGIQGGPPQPQWGRNDQMGSGINQGGPPQKDPVQAIIEQANSTQLFETLSKFKHFSLTQPDQARNILNSNPQLALALLHSQVVLGMMSPQTAQQIINKQGVGIPNQGPQPSQPQFNQSPNMYQGTMGMSNPNMGVVMNNPNMGGGMNGPGMNNPNMGGGMGMMNGPGMNPQGGMGMGVGGGMNNPNMGGGMNGPGMNNPNMGGGMNGPGMNNPNMGVGMNGPGMNNPNMGGGMNQGSMNNPNMGGGMNQGSMMYGPNGPNQGGGSTPPPPGISSAAMNNWNILTENQKQFVHYVINLTPQQIESQIPMNTRTQVMQIRNLYSRP